MLLIWLAHLSIAVYLFMPCALSPTSSSWFTWRQQQQQQQQA
jgi:hypothetical protein